MLNTKPILDLFTRLGKTETDKVTVCYFGPKNPWTSKSLPLANADIFAQTLTANGMNVYTMVNSVDESVITSANTRGDVNDIVRLNALWADLDYKDSGINNYENAMGIIESISAIIGANPCAIVHSGHGLQPYWPIEDGEIDDMNRSMVAGISRRFGQLIQRVAELYGGKVDNVSDLPRVLRAPGTINHKDAEHPVNVEVEFNDFTYPIELSQVVEALESHGFISDNTTVSEFVVVAPPEEWRIAQDNCAWTAQLLDSIDKANPKARHPWLLAQAIKIYASVRYGCFTEEGYNQAAQLLEAKFLNLLTEGEKRQPHPGEVQTAFKWAKQMVSTYSEAKLSSEVRNHVHKLHLSAVPDLPKGQASVSTTTDGSLAVAPELAPIGLPMDAFKYTDVANAERLADFAQGKFIFVPDLGWYRWENSTYVPDTAKSIERLAAEAALSFGALDASKAGMDWAKKSLSRSALTSSVMLAQSVPDIIVLPHELDKNPLELCTPNGIVNLETGVLRDADPKADYNTMQTTVAPSQKETPMWDQFLKLVITDEDRINYIQELLGIALIGEVRWHVLPVFVGVGANGKSTLLEIASKILGTYARSMPENFLLDTNTTQHATEIANLRGVRFAVASETRPDGKFNESRIKMLTGGDTISARKMYKDFFDFKPSHTLFLAVNHLPTVRSGGSGFWRRLRKIDFSYQVPEALQKQGLSDDIVKYEGPGVLAWMIEGAIRVLNNGLSEPDAVKLATTEYRFEEDHMSKFIEDCVVVNAASMVSAQELLQTYRTWCDMNGETSLAMTPFLREMRMRMPISPQRGGAGRRMYAGIYLYNIAGNDTDTTNHEDRRYN
jgi:P4 family phage/plasmid primase-like protien